MRKLILISAFVLASVSAQAGEIREQILAVNDAPAAAATAAPAAVATAAPATPAAPAATADTTAPQASQAPKASMKQASRSQKPQAVSRERRAEGAPDRRQVRHLLVMRKFVIVAAVFWLALACQNSHRGFGGAGA